VLSTVAITFQATATTSPLPPVRAVSCRSCRAAVTTKATEAPAPVEIRRPVRLRWRGQTYRNSCRISGLNVHQRLRPKPGQTAPLSSSRAEAKKLDGV
jgi:hypothetical protein